MTAEIARHPDQPDLLVQRAMQYRLDGQLAAALADCDAARRKGCKSHELALQRGLTLAALGRDADAESELSTCAQSATPSVEALAARARIRERARRFDAALADYGAAIDLRPTPELYVARGRLLESMKRLDDAAAGYREGLARLGGAVSLRLELIRLETQRGRHDAAIALIDEELLRAGDKTDWLLRRAEVLSVAGRPVEAKQDCRKALAEANRAVSRRCTATKLYSRARVHVAMGQIDAARTDLKQALKLSPRCAEAARLLEELETRKNPDRPEAGSTQPGGQDHAKK